MVFSMRRMTWQRWRTRSTAFLICYAIYSRDSSLFRRQERLRKGITFKTCNTRRRFVKAFHPSTVSPLFDLNIFLFHFFGWFRGWDLNLLLGWWRIKQWKQAICIGPVYTKRTPSYCVEQNFPPKWSHWTATKKMMNFDVVADLSCAKYLICYLIDCACLLSDIPIAIF